MKRINNKRVTFIDYNMDQLMLPMSLNSIIPQNHLVRVVNSAIERMNLKPLLNKYKGGGRSSYHPEMMLKVIVYAYTQRIYSSRKIAKALRENINFMWISGNNKPDFRTINRFRSEKLKDIIDDVFSSILELLIEDGYVKLENYFLDGTKVEANANRYTFVWGKSTKKYKAKLKENIKNLLKEIDEVNDEENRRYGDKDLEELGEDNDGIDIKKIDKKMKELEERLENGKKNKTLKKVVKKMKSDYIPRYKKYEKQEEILGKRNSYSKTDHDATFMRMKEDHMRNGQLKPGYNVQIGTENQFVIDYTIHQRAGNSGCFIPHLKHLEKTLGKLPENMVADSGYGSEENYAYIEEKNLGNYVKYNMFHKEQKKKFKEDISKYQNWSYDEENDEFICAAGRRLKYEFTSKYVTDNRYKTERRNYICESCKDCEIKDKCFKSKGNRRIGMSFVLNGYRDKVKTNLLSEKGLELRSKRPIEVESVFGQIKNNRGFRRFMLRGLEKVKIEWGLLSIAHNLAKIATS